MFPKELKANAIDLEGAPQMRIDESRKIRILLFHRKAVWTLITVQDETVDRPGRDRGLFPNLAGHRGADQSRAALDGAEKSAVK